MTATGTLTLPGPTTPSASLATASSSSTGRFPTTPVAGVAATVSGVGGVTFKPKFGAVIDGKVLF